MITAYRSLLLVPHSKNSKKLQKTYLDDNRQEIQKDLCWLRQQTDSFFSKMFTQMNDESVKNSEVTKRKLSDYPLNCSLEITRHLLSLLSKQHDPERKGIAALQAFSVNGGRVKHIWGGVNETNFHHALQAADYYLDVAKDATGSNKTSIGIQPLSKSGFNNFSSFREFANVAEASWNCRVLPNRYFPNLAPFFPMILFYDNGNIRLATSNNFMFAMNIEENFSPAESFVFWSETYTEDHSHIVSSLHKVMAQSGVGRKDQKLWEFYSDKNLPGLEQAFKACRSLHGDELEAKVKQMLGCNLLIGKVG